MSLVGLLKSLVKGVQIVVLLLLQPIQPQIEQDLHNEADDSNGEDDGRDGQLGPHRPVIGCEFAQNEFIRALLIAEGSLADVKESLVCTAVVPI